MNTMAARGGKKYELLALLRERSNLSAQQIADALGINRTSVYRIIDSCYGDNYHLIHEKGKYRLRNQDRDQATFEFSLSGQQAHDLVTAARSIKTLTPHAQKALDIIKNKMGRDDLEKEPAVYYHSYDEINPTIYTTIVSAIKSRHCLELDYQPAREGAAATQHIFDPYKILFWNGHYYLVGSSHAYKHKPSKGEMHLRLDRIQGVKVETNEKRSKRGNNYDEPATFANPKFHPQQYVERVFGTFGGKEAPVNIALHFPASVAKAAAEVDRHTSKRLEWRADNSLIYHLTVPLSPEIVWWVASWSGVRVLEPTELREKVYLHALEVAQLNAPDAVKSTSIKRLEEAA